MDNDKFFKILDKRIALFEKLVERKTKRLAETDDIEVLAEVYEDLAQLGINYINDIKIDCLRFTKKDNADSQQVEE